jgi:hypothetical protein
LWVVAYQCAPRILQRCVQQDNGASCVTKHLIGPAASGAAQLRAWESIEAKNTVRRISFSEEDLPFGEVRASHCGLLNRQ